MTSHESSKKGPDLWKWAAILGTAAVAFVVLGFEV